MLNATIEKGIGYPLPEELSGRKLSWLLFPSDRSKPEYKMSDYEYVHRELQKNGVTLNLLWLEYCEKFREKGELSYQLTQFKKHYRDYTVKSNATMHLNHKTGEIAKNGRMIMIPQYNFGRTIIIYSELNYCFFRKCVVYYTHK